MPKPDLRKTLGCQGEQLAENWLIKHGYQSVCRNYTLTGGQIDLVMYSPQGNLVFVEVKTRWASRPSTTVEHRIGPLQLAALRRAAAHFLSLNPFPFANWQLDLLWITLHHGRPVKAKIRHYQNVLEV